MAEKEPGFKLEKEIDKTSDLENIRKRLRATLRRLEAAGEQEKRGELFKKEFLFFGPERYEKSFSREVFPKLIKGFWEAQKEYSGIDAPKNAVEQNIFWNSKSHPIKGEIFNGFKDGGERAIPEDLSAEGILPFEKRRAAVIVVDREKDKELANLCDWARELKKKIPDEEERVFQIVQLVFKRMGENRETEIFREVERMNRSKEEILLGNIEHEQCRFRSLLVQVLAIEADLDSTLAASTVKDGLTDLLGQYNGYNQVVLKNDEILIADAVAPPLREEFGNMNYSKLKKMGGFPRWGSNKSPYGIYFDEKDRFQLGRLGVNGLKKLLER